MLIRSTLCSLAVLLLAPGCLYDEGEQTDPEVAVSKLPNKPVPGVPNMDAPVEVVRPTADGELVRHQYPQLAPYQEVPEGAVCGVQDHTGTVLSCQPGTFCNQPSEGAPATCVRAPSSPIWER